MIQNPLPAEKSPPARHATGNVLLYACAFVILIAGLRAASSIVVPFLLSAFLSIVVMPPLKALERRLGFSIAFSLVMLALVLLFLSVPIMVGGALQQVVRFLPELQKQLGAWAAGWAQQIEAWEIGISSEDLTQALNPAGGTALLARLLNGLMEALSNGIIVLIMTGFMLAEGSWFSAKLSMLDGGSGIAGKRIGQITENARRYLGIKTLVSLATGILIWLCLRMLGVSFAPVWGLLAFMLNYIPTLGSILAGIPPFALALVQNGSGIALAVAVCFLLVNQLFGSIIEPRLQGLGLGLSPLIVFVSLLFWGWVLGPVGMLLSAPLTMLLRIAFEEFPETRWLAVLLAGNPKSLATTPAS